jgi:predicted metal-binding membrane protein
VEDGARRVTTVAAERQSFRSRVPPVVIVAIVAGWALAIAAQLNGAAASLHHDALIEGGGPLSAGLLLFLLAWQAMVAAMMLPSSLPLIRLFEAASSRQDHPVRVRAAFLGGYAAVWSGFGALAFIGDADIHHVVHAVPWLEEHEWVIAGSVLAIAGAFQFSDLKDKCLTKCRHPGPYLLSHYKRGVKGAFKLGAGHGLFCVGCCWALMLVMFAAGIAMLWWMAALTAVMVYEKTGRHGSKMTPYVGVTLLALAALTLLHATWFPNLFPT